jgi:hypothetical protein
VVHQVGSAKNLTQYKGAKLLVVDNERPIIPTFVLPIMQILIGKGWERDCSGQPIFDQILDQLQTMQVKLTANINPSKLSRFVKIISYWQETNTASAAIGYETLRQSVS